MCPLTRATRMSCRLKSLLSDSSLSPTVTGFLLFVLRPERGGAVGACKATERACQGLRRRTAAAATSAPEWNPTKIDARLSVHVVLAGHQAPDAVLTLIVGLCRVDRVQA